MLTSKGWKKLYTWKDAEELAKRFKALYKYLTERLSKAAKDIERVC
jgi:flagellin-specific chaperone FliS